MYVDCWPESTAESVESAVVTDLLLSQLVDCKIKIFTIQIVFFLAKNVNQSMNMILI